jgi:hypothetical protein
VQHEAPLLKIKETAISDDCLLCSESFAVIDNFKFDPIQITLKVDDLREIEHYPNILF